jgi:hypothetical protein
LGKFPDLFFEKSFNASRPMVIYFHGWTKSVKDQSVLAMRAAYVNYNVATVDWSFYASDQRYLTKVIPQLKIVRSIKIENDLFHLIQFLCTGC